MESLFSRKTEITKAQPLSIPVHLSKYLKNTQPPPVIDSLPLPNSSSIRPPMTVMKLQSSAINPPFKMTIDTPHLSSGSMISIS
ncbi:hypothetical protein YC2023_093408 [Brassica napus]